MSEDDFDVDNPSLAFSPSHEDFDDDMAGYEEDIQEDSRINQTERSDGLGDLPSHDQQPGHYPNLQVTQNIIHPKKLRRRESADIDPFQ